MKECVSCHRIVKDFVEFLCPNCGKNKIVRCQVCRRNIVEWTCSNCGFEGP